MDDRTEYHLEEIGKAQNPAEPTRTAPKKPGRFLASFRAVGEYLRVLQSMRALKTVLTGTPSLNKEQIDSVAPLLQRILKADVQTRLEIQKYGVNIVPTDFYSIVPSLKGIEESFEYVEGEPPYLLDSVLQADALVDFLSKLSQFAIEFDPPVQGDEENCSSFFWQNSQFSFSDAMSYYCFIRLVKPKTILEIGSGFSTLVALQAVQKNGFGKIVCVEPYPRSFLEKNRNIELRRIKAQDLTAVQVSTILSEGDILFIDSTHTVKTGSDCLHMYLRVLPQLRMRILVHVHDVFLPFGLPKDWLTERQLYWTEQYLLLALLIGNSKAKMLYGSSYHYFKNRPMLDEFMKRRYPSGGGSFWFEYDGSLEEREHTAR